VNADGFSDVVVGAPGYDDGDFYEGYAFAYHGSTTGLGTPVWSAEGNQDDAAFGTSVAAAGDVNGDGYGDVIVGAPLFDFDLSSTLNCGLVNVYLGSSIGLSATAAWWNLVNDDLAQTGHSVACAGDFHGDGFSDLIVGAPGTFTEMALVYFGNGSPGLERRPRQARTDGSAPISALGMSDSPSAFRLEALGRTAGGRGGVRLQYEIEPFGTPFSGSGLVTGDVFDTGAPTLGIGSAVPLSEVVGGLDAGTLYHWRLRVSTDSPFFPHSPWLSIPDNAPSEADIRTATSATGVVAALPVASGPSLEPGAPNPFVTSTQLRFSLPARGRARLAIYDVSGRKVTSLADEVHEVGAYTQAWDGRNAAGAHVPSGVYFARLEFGGRVENRKLVLIR
jgi:hypothetical protein